MSPSNVEVAIGQEWRAPEPWGVGRVVGHVDGDLWFVKFADGTRRVRLPGDPARWELVGFKGAFDLPAAGG